MINFLLVLGTGMTAAGFWGIVLYVICEDIITEGINNRVWDNTGIFDGKTHRWRGRKKSQKNKPES